MDRKPAAFVIVVVGLVLLGAQTAQARIPIPIHTGDDIIEVAPLPQEVIQLSDDPKALSDWKLGWKFARFGVLFSDVWTWNHHLVAFKENTYSDLPAEVQASIAPKYPFAKCNRGGWRRYGAKVLVGLIVVGLLLQLKEKVFGPTA